MDKYEFRRLALRELVNSLSPGGQAKIAKETEIEANYISRMLYVKGKAGKKNIGEGTVETINKHFPGWLDIDIGSVGENLFSAKKRSDRERAIQDIIALLRDMDSQGVKMVLLHAKTMHNEFPISKQTKSSL